MKELHGCGMLFDDSQVCEEGSETWMRYCDAFKKETLQTALPDQIEKPENQSKPLQSNSTHGATNPEVADGTPMSSSYGNGGAATSASRSEEPLRGKPKNRKRLILGALAFVIFLVIAFRTNSPDLDDPKAVAKIVGEAVDANKFQLRNQGGKELAYLPNSDSPYTGWVKKLRDGKLQKLSHFIDGMIDGPVLLYHSNGQKILQGNCKNGLKHGKSLSWYENGQKEDEITYSSDLISKIITWKPNGEKCQGTNVRDGSGNYYGYEVDGTLSWKRIVKDGKIVDSISITN